MSNTTKYYHITYLYGNITIYKIFEIVRALSLVFPPLREAKKQKKEEPFVCLDDRELEDCVEEAQAKLTQYATKYAVNVYQGTSTLYIRHSLFRNVRVVQYSSLVRVENVSFRLVQVARFHNLLFYL